MFEKKSLSGVHAVDGLDLCDIASRITSCPEPPSISKSDKAFLLEGMEFICDGSMVHVDDLNDLFVKVCFTSDVSRRALAQTSIDRT